MDHELASHTFSWEDKDIPEKVAARLLEMVQAVTMKPVSLDDSLLESGLVDSISAVDLALQVESEMGVEIPAEKIHEHLRTARTLVNYVLAAHH